MNIKQKHFLDLADYDAQTLLKLLEYAQELKKRSYNGKKIDVLKNKTLVMYFSKPSLRTRVSFEVGIQKLGGHSVVIKQDEIILGQRESIEDTARVLSRYVHGVTIRTFAHDDVVQFAKYSTVPVINALTDYSHPCQIMADLLTVKEYFKTFSGIKLAYIGDGNNVANSLMQGCAILGIDISVATPAGYEPNENWTALARKLGEKTNSKIEITNSPTQAAKDANVLYTDVWASMGQEAEHAKRIEAFSGYQINKDLLKHAAPNCIVLHCLPAHKGEEISAEVFELNAKSIFDQTENRMYAQMSIMASIM